MKNFTLNFVNASTCSTRRARIQSITDNFFVCLSAVTEHCGVIGLSSKWRPEVSPLESRLSCKVLADCARYESHFILLGLLVMFRRSKSFCSAIFQHLLIPSWQRVGLHVAILSRDAFKINSASSRNFL